MTQIIDDLQLFIRPPYRRTPSHSCVAIFFSIFSSCLWSALWQRSRREQNVLRYTQIQIGEERIHSDYGQHARSTIQRQMQVKLLSIVCVFTSFIQKTAVLSSTSRTISLVSVSLSLSLSWIICMQLLFEVKANCFDAHYIVYEYEFTVNRHISVFKQVTHTRSLHSLLLSCVACRTFGQINRPSDRQTKICAA